ncbi:MAG: hypothetical protein ACPIOQ_85650, partial [Promethearchaeia archaeon]
MFATVDAQFDETYFPFRLVDQRVHGMHSRHAKLEQLSLFHDLPNPTIEQLVERINSASVPGEDVTWNLSDLVQSPSTLSDVEQAQAGSSGEHTGHNSNRGEHTGQEVSEWERTGNSGDKDQDRGGLPSDPYGIETEPPSTEAERATAQQELGTPVVTGADLRMLKQTVFAQ